MKCQPAGRRDSHPKSVILGMGSFRLGSTFGVREEQGQVRWTNVTERGGEGMMRGAGGGEVDQRH